MKTPSKKIVRSILTSPISSRLKPLSLLPAATALLAFPFHQSANAASVTWTGASGNDWNTGSNWSTSSKPNPADTAIFNTSLSNVAIGSAQTITSVSFDTLSGTSGATFTLGTLGGAALTGSNSGTIQITGTLSGSAKNFTINAPFVIIPVSGTTTGAYTFQNNSADPTNTLNFAGPVTSATTTSTTTLTLTGSNMGANTISGSITSGSAAAFALTKNGAGTWILTGANNYNGATAITGGTLQYSGATGANAGTGAIQLWAGSLVIDNTGASGNNNTRIADTSALTLYGGAFLYKGSEQASTPSTETVGAITQGLGSGVITVAYGGSNLATLTGASFAHTVGNGSALINGVNLGKNNTDTGSVGKLILTSAPTLTGATVALASGINAASQNTKIVPFLVGEAATGTGGLGTATGTANTFVTYIAGSGVRPLNPTDEFTNNAITAGNNTYITLSSTAAASAAINSLVINGGDLSIADGQTLTNTSGALLFASSNAIKPAGTTGALSFGSGTEGMITVNAGVTGTIGANITASGANALTISGAGTLVLAGSNSYTGTTNFGNAGSTLVLGSKYALGSGTAIMSLNGATSSYGATPAMAATIIALTDMSGANALTNPFYFNTGNSGTAIVAGSNNITFAGPVTDTAYSLSLQNNLSNGATLLISGNLTVPSNRPLNISGSGNTTITGNITAHNGGTFSSSGITTLSGSDADTGTYTLSAGTLVIGNIYATGTAGFTSSGGVVQAAIDLSAGLPNALTLNGNLTVSGTNNLKFNGTTTNYNSNRVVTNNIAPASGTLTLAGNVYLSQDATYNRSLTIAGTGNTLISGTIANYSGGSGIAEALTITSTGTTTLSGQSVFTGAFSQTGAGTVALTGTMNGPSGYTVNNASALFNESAAGALLGGTATFVLTNGTANLSVPNSYSGGTTLTAGLLNLGDKGALGSGTLALNGGALAALSPLTGANSVANTISLGGNGSVLGTNSLQLGGSLVNSGTNRTLTSNIAPASGTFTLAGNIYLSEDPNTSRTLTLAGTGNTVISGTIANNSTLSGSAGSLTITNTGTTTLTGQSVFTGAFSQTGAGTVALTGTMNGPSNVTVNNASAVFNESAAGALLGGTATFVLTNGTANLSVPNSYSGGTTLTAGLLNLGDKGALGSGTLALNGGALVALSPMTGANSVANTVSLGGNGSVQGTNSLQLGGAITNSGGNYTLTSGIAPASGTLTLAGNVYLSESSTSSRTLTLAGTGNTVISGTIANNSTLGGSAASLTITNTGVTTISGQSVFTGTFSQTGAGTVALTGTMNGPAAFVVNNASAVFNESATNALQGTAAAFTLTNGTANLSVPNSYSGGTTLTAGLLNLGDKGALGSGTLALNGGALVALSPMTGANAVANNTTLGGNVTVQGNNSLELSGTMFQTYNRTLTNNISGGNSLIISGPVISTGGYTLTGAGSGLTTISGLISATNTLTYAGSGTMQLTNPGNTFTGTIKASSGKLKLAPTGASLTSTNQFQSNVGAVLEFGGDPANNNVLADTTGLNNTLNLGLNLFTSGTWTSNNGTSMKCDLTVDGASVIFTSSHLSLTGTGAAGTIAFNMKSGSLATTSAVTYGFRVNCYNGSVTGASLPFSGTQSGGLITVINPAGGTTQGFALGGTSSSVVSSYTMTGGTMNVIGSGANGYLSLGADAAGTSTTTFSLSGGRVYVSAGIEGETAGGNEIFNFTGGSLAAATINATNLRAPGDSSNGTFTENGASALLDVTGTNTTVTGNLALLSGSVQIGAARTLTVSGALNGSQGAVITGIASGTGTLSVAPTTSSTFAGIIQDGSGQIALTKSGAGSLTLTGSNSYTGTTTISTGTLQIGDGTVGDDGSLASAGIVNQSILTFNLFGNQTCVGAISGMGSLAKSGAGSLTLTGSNSFTGTTTVNSGTLQVGNGTTGALSGSSAVTVNGGGTLAVNLANTGTLGSTIQLGGSSGSLSAINLVGGGTNTLAGNITGPVFGSINQTGSGTTILSGYNQLFGPLNINAGAVQLSSSNSALDSIVNVNANNGLLFGVNALTIGGLGGSGNFALVNGTNAVALTASNTYFNSIYSGAMSGNGSLTKSGPYMLTLSGSSSYSGPTNVNAGVLAIGAANNLGDGSTTNTLSFNGGTLESTGNTYDLGANRSITLNGAGTLQSDAGTLTVSGSVSGAKTLTVTGSGNVTISGMVATGAGSIVKTGAGTLVLSSSNNYTGGTTISSGTVQLGNNYGLGSAAGNLTLNGGTLDLNGYASTVAALTGGPATSITNGSATSGTITVTSGSFGGTISDGAGQTYFVKQGASTTVLTLTGTNTFTGSATIGSGTTVVSNIGNSGVAGNLGAALNSGTQPIQIKTGGWLSYTGVGETTDRNVLLVDGDGSSMAIASNGAGALSLSGTISSKNDNATVGAEWFILGGTNTEANTILGTFVESAGNNHISVSKQGAGTWVLSGTKSYQAVTDVENGILQFDSIANTGSTCSLGKASMQYAILPSVIKTSASNIGTTVVPYQIALGTGSTTGILQYTGSANGSSNRQFGLNGNGVVSTASGAGTLTLSGTVAPVVSSNVTLTLDANNAGTNTASGVIADLAGASTTASTTGSNNVNYVNVASTAGFSIGQTLSTGTGLAANTVILGITSGTLFVSPYTSGTVVNGATIAAGGAQMAVTKTGPGTWTLSGSNTYSGGTAVNSGTLRIGNTNALGVGGLTVNSGALDLHGYSVSVPAFSGAGGSVTNMGSGTSTLTATAASGTATYAGNIADGTGSVVLANSGAGTLILGGSLTMTGLNANSGVTQLTQSGSIGAVNVSAGATVSMAAHSGSNYNVLNISSLTISGFASLLGADNAEVASAAYTPIDASSQNNAGVLTNAGLAVTQAATPTSAIEPASPDAVPEPGMLGMLLAGALGMLGLRRQRGSRD